MNANYQHLSIPAAAILLTIFVAAFLVFRAKTPDTHTPAEQNNVLTSTAAPDNATFAPFQASENPAPTEHFEPIASAQKPEKPKRYQKAKNLAQAPDLFPQLPLNAPRPLIDLDSEIPEPPPTPESIRRRREQRWAAKINVEQEAKINAVLDAAEQRHIEIMTNNLNRRAAIETVDRITPVCFEELYTRAPDAAGRIIVNFEIIGDAQGRGIFENVHIATNYNLNDMAFEACIVAAIQSALFQAVDAGRLWVEHALHTEQIPHR